MVKGKDGKKDINVKMGTLTFNFNDPKKVIKSISCSAADGRRMAAYLLDADKLGNVLSTIFEGTSVTMYRSIEGIAPSHEEAAAEGTPSSKARSKRSAHAI